jgi:replicative DNA helicase Mcm
MYIRFAGFADLYVALSDFRKENLDRLVVTKGNIASRDDPKLCLAVAVYSCPHCGRSYRIPIAHGKRVPKSHPCECERKAELVPEDCVRDDTAFLALTEPVITTSSEEPVTRTVQLIGSDLVHKSRFPQLQPGIDVKLTGVLKAYKPPKQSMEDYILLVESVEPLQTEFEYITFTEEEREKILKLGNEKGIIKKLRDSIAPHIHGYEEIKDAVLLQFFEGTKPKLSRPGRATRNSIHILLIGDPGTAKTDMCNSAATLHPKAVMVHGPGATGKGITAVVEKSEAGTFRVKAGALVRANNGLCVIEEFGNLPKEDRVHLKTVMENENYILEKAGQRRTFKTHCSILANANPKTGAYDPYAKSIPEQFDIDRALQDRFDLIFPITDISEKEKDALVSQVMLRKHTENISGNVKGTKPPIAPDLFKKYVAYARRNVNPVLTKEAEEEITRQFVEFRNVYRNQIAVTKSEITARAQNTIVRLAEARAKAELRDEVSPEDVKEAGRIIHYALRETYKANENATELDFGKHYELSGTEIDRMRTLENLIRQEVNKKKEVTEDYVISMAMNEHELESLPPHEIEKYLTELQKKGIIFKPKAGIIKLVTER